MHTLKRHSTTPVMMTLALLGVMALPASGDVVSSGPQVGQWKTWVLVSGNEIRVPAPPAETSDQTTAELAELRQLQKERSPMANTAIQYYNAVPATQRWHDLAFELARAEKQTGISQARLAAILHTALHDAVIATWAAKYQFNRKPPSQMAPDVIPAVTLTGAGTLLEPPPAFDSAECQEELVLLKRINRSPTPSQRAIATNLAAKGRDFIWRPGYALVHRGRLSVPREVRLLASFAALQMDAFIAAHDAKYTFWRLRPNMADDTIVPLIPQPNHPAYVSNAAIIASAAAALVGSMFPQEAAQWRYLGDEPGLSRIYAGIHYPSDERAAHQMGKRLGALAIQRDQLNGL